MIPYFYFPSFHLGPLAIHVWGLAAALGFLAGLLIAWKRAEKKGLSGDKILGLGTVIVLCSLLFARLFYVLFGGELAMFLKAPWLFFAFWQGGMAATGGFFGAGLALLWFWRGQRFSPPTRGGGGGLFWPYLESLAYGFLFGWLIGRLGCFLIHDHPGRLTNSFLGVNFPDGTRFDLGLLEMLAIMPLAVIFLFLSRQEDRGGRRGKKFFAPTAHTYAVWLLLWYGLTRFCLDFLRATDLPNSDLHFWSLTLGQWGSVGLVIIGACLLIKKIRRYR